MKKHTLLLFITFNTSIFANGPIADPGIDLIDINSTTVVRLCLFHEQVYEYHKLKNNNFATCSFDIGETQNSTHPNNNHDIQPHDPECFSDAFQQVH